MNSALVERVKAHEGLRLKPYRCTAGKLSIGYGRNLEDRGISEEEARQMLERDLREAVAVVKLWLVRGDADAAEGVGPETLSRLGRVDRFAADLSVQWWVLVELAFWLGAGTLRKFKRFREAVLDYRFDDAADELLWADEARTIPTKLHQQAPARTARLAEILREGRE